MLSPTHIHLLINHLPVFGSFMGLLVLAYGIWKRSNHTKNAAYLVLIIASIGAIIAYLTGGSAEETVEKLQGVSKEMLETHEDAGLFALYGFIVLGVFSLIGLYVNQRKPLAAKTFGIIVLIISMISFSIVARTAYIGGQIRHSEIRNSAPLDAPAYDSEDSE